MTPPTYCSPFVLEKGARRKMPGFSNLDERTPGVYETGAGRSECVIMEEIGHFPMYENPVTFKKYLMPVLGKVLKARS